MRGFDDRAIQSQLTCPRLCFVGGADGIASDPTQDGIPVDVGAVVRERRAELATLGWDVRILDALDHIGAGRPGPVLGVLRPWLVAALDGR